jgi:hypothetical protein
LLLILHEKNDDDSTSKRVSVVQDIAPPLLVDVHLLNKQLKTKTDDSEKDRVWLVP